LFNEKLANLLSQVQGLPSVPAIYQEMQATLRSPDAEIRAVGRIIAKDVGMTAKILQLVNSAFFGIRRNVSDPGQAATLLGLEKIRALVLSYNVFSHFDKAKAGDLSFEKLWQHSLTVGALARQIAVSAGAGQEVADESFTAGMLHDAGTLVLVTSLPESFKAATETAKQKKLVLHEAEYQTIGTSHAEIGAYLLGLWGLPHSIVGAIAYHHTPARAPHKVFSALTALHVADSLHDARASGGAGHGNTIDVSYLTELGLADRLPAWQTLCNNSDKEAPAP
jgi:HD-like signal output (HDOD) protein